MKKIAFYTLGCKVNQYETEAVSELFENNGYEIVPFSDPADYYVINTCSVTSMSDRKSRQIIRRAKKTNQDSVIAVMGCYSQTAPDEVLDIDGVNLVLGTKDKGSVVNLISTLTKDDKLNAVTSVKDNHTFEDLRVKKCLDHTRAFIKIQDGCSGRCLVFHTGGAFPSGCGHTGFTGTSIWLDREADIGLALLTNRLYYDHLPTADMNAFRRRVHEALLAQNPI